MKTTSILSLLFILSSCGVVSKMGDSVAKSMTPKINLNEEKDIDQLGNYTEGKYIAQGPVSCLLKTAIVEVPITIVETLFRGLLNKNFDIVFSEELSTKIVEDLREKSQINKIKAEEFWNLLDPALAEELNAVLLDKYLDRSDESFKALAQEIAYGFTVLVETGKYEIGLSLKLTDDSAIERRISIAFSEEAKEKITIGDCSKINISKINLNADLKLPSDITTQFICENDDGDKIEVMGENNQSLTLRYQTEDTAGILKINQENLELLKDKKTYRVLGYSDYEIQDLKIELTKDFDFAEDSNKKVYINNSIDEASIEFTLYGSKKVKLKNLDCNVRKTLL